MSDSPSGYEVYLKTALNRRPEQLRGVLRRKVEDAILPRLPVDVDGWYRRQIPAEIDCAVSPVETVLSHRQTACDDRQRSRRRAEAVGRGVVTFLNSSHDFREQKWHTGPLDEEPLLWWLKLQGFEHLRWLVEGFDTPDSAPEQVREAYRSWIQTWQRESQIASRPGFLRRNWIPHSVSLRILNLTWYLAWADGTVPSEFEDRVTRTLYRNALFLRDHVETDVGGNHLIENAAALVVAGVVLDERQFRRKGEEVFEKTSEEQFLGDGAHFERSPMYHVAVLTRYLTARAVLDAAGESVPAAIEDVCVAGTRYLARLRPPDGRIPLLHDSVFEETLALDECLEYARLCGVEIETPAPRTDLREAGYYWLGDDDSTLLVSGGPLAVPHVPGHAHVHPAHLILWVDGHRVFTDTGTFAYDAGERRQYARSTRAHNTVTVDEISPATVGGTFLMADSVTPETTTYRRGPTALSTVYESSRRPSYTHRRTLYHADDWWVVWDTVTQDPRRSVHARYHVHPEYDVQTGTDVREPSIVTEDGTPLVRCDTVDATVRTIETEYFDEFGSAHDRETLLVDLGSGTVSGGCLLSRSGDPTLQRDDGKPTAVVDDQRRWELPPIEDW